MFYTPTDDSILEGYQNAKAVYASLGLDTERALAQFEKVGISIHSWAGDDVTGFETHEGGVHSENTVTGNYPGRARNGGELRQDLEQAMRFSPCTHRLGLQSMYAEPKTQKERCDYDVEDFRNWIDFAKKHHMAVDYNVSYFTHPMMKDGCSLASPTTRCAPIGSGPGSTGGASARPSAANSAARYSTTPGRRTASRTIP